VDGPSSGKYRCILKNSFEDLDRVWGSATLVTIDNTSYLLVAAHVWKSLKEADEIGISANFFRKAGIVHERWAFDSIDMGIDLSLPGVPKTFAGVSGGGLWRIVSSATGGQAGSNSRRGRVLRVSLRQWWIHPLSWTPEYRRSDAMVDFAIVLIKTIDRQCSNFENLDRARGLLLPSEPALTLCP
jgi:hypothetical protein